MLCWIILSFHWDTIHLLLLSFARFFLASCLGVYASAFAFIVYFGWLFNNDLAPLVCCSRLISIQFNSIQFLGLLYSLHQWQSGMCFPSSKTISTLSSSSIAYAVAASTSCTCPIPSSLSSSNNCLPSTSNTPKRAMLPITIVAFAEPFFVRRHFTKQS